MTDNETPPSHETLAAKTELGISAKVQRGTESGSLIAKANRALGDIAEFIQKDCEPDRLREAHYVGSAAVHIYAFPTMGECLFVSQTDPLRDTPEKYASDAFQVLKANAFRQLEGDMMAHYGRKRRKMRSGV